MKAKLAAILKGALVAACGAVATYLRTALVGADFGNATPAEVAAWSVVANAIRKLFAKDAPAPPTPPASVARVAA